MQYPSIDFPIEALIDSTQPLDVRLSPDGSYVAVVIGQYHKKDKDTPPEQSIYIVETATKKMRLLTTNTNAICPPCVYFRKPLSN